MDGTLNDIIINIVRERQRNCPPTRGVLPKTVSAFLDFYRAEQTLRRDMSALARAGRLQRMGGEGSRRGYRVPVPVPVVEAHDDELPLLDAPVHRAEWTFQFVIRVPMRVA